MSRLFADYPRERLTVLTGSYAFKTDTTDERLAGDYVLFPTTKPRGLFGFGRIIHWIDYCLTPLSVLLGIFVVRRKQIQVILSVAHGHFFIPAALVSLLTSVPYILIVHDDWVSRMQSKTVFFKGLFPFFFKFALKAAKHVYAVSPEMKEMLQSQYGVESELQWPASERIVSYETAALSSDEKDPACVQLAFAGYRNAAVLDSLEILVQLVKGERLLSYGLTSWMLHLYVPLDFKQVKALGWEHKRIKVHGWVSQNEIRRALGAADILFLPYSFRKDVNFLTMRSFPSKTADYLASGKPILVFAPTFSTVSQYARKFGFAEVVNEPSESALAKGIYRLWSSKSYLERLRANALRVFEQNHNIIIQRKSFLETINKITSASQGKKGSS